MFSSPHSRGAVSRAAVVLVGVGLAGCAGSPAPAADPHQACRSRLAQAEAERDARLGELERELGLARDDARARQREVDRLRREVGAARETAVAQEQSFAAAVAMVEQREATIRELEGRLEALGVGPDDDVSQGVEQLLRRQAEQLDVLRDELARARAGELPDPDAAVAGGVRPAGLDLEEPVAVVDGAPLTRRSFCAFLYRDLATPELLHLFVNRHLVLREGERRGVEVPEVDAITWVGEQLSEHTRSAGGREELEQKLAEQGYTLEAWEARLRYQARPALTIERLVAIERDTPAGRDAFERRLRTEFRRRYSERVSARHVFFHVPEDATPGQVEVVRRQAEAAWREIDQGTSFEVVARRASQDAATRDVGGYLGEIGREKFAELPRLNTVLFTIEPGTVSRPIRTRAGFHIVMVDERRSPDRSFDEVRAALAEELAAAPPSDAEMQALLDRLRAGAHVVTTLSFDDR